MSLSTFAEASPFIGNSCSRVPLHHQLSIPVYMHMIRTVVADPCDENEASSANLTHRPYMLPPMVTLIKVSRSVPSTGSNAKQYQKPGEPGIHPRRLAAYVERQLAERRACNASPNELLNLFHDVADEFLLVNPPAHATDAFRRGTGIRSHIRRAEPRN